MKIAIDVMGGDNGPTTIIRGAIMACNSNHKLHLILVGKSDIIKRELKKHNFNQEQIEIVSASQVIEMDEAPSKALRKKKDSSIAIASTLVRKNKADAFVSAGSTGAVMASGLLKIGRIKGVKRPAIAAVFPGFEGRTLLLDAGANARGRSEVLVQHALMGQIYASEVLHKSNPKVGLLSNGEEEKKGNELTKEVHQELKKMDNINFIGNIEGRDIFTGEYDVVLCDGFVGNIVLKTSEGLADFLFKIIKSEIQANWLSKLGGLLLKPAFKRIMSRVDYTEYGGAPLLGIDGVTIISHGSSDAKAIKNAIEVAKESVNRNLIGLIKANIDGRTD